MDTQTTLEQELEDAVAEREVVRHELAELEEQVRVLGQQAAHAGRMEQATAT